MPETPESRRWKVPMLPRDPAEAHRAATPLELFFDLVFVVAIALASDRLHHAVLEGHAAEGILSYGMVFFAIWWAWMNFTWFASAYDTDDVPYRLAVFVQIIGSLVLAAGVREAFETRDFAVVTYGYVIMRLALVGQWVRAGRSDPRRRTTAHRYALGIAACQLGWISLLRVPEGWVLYGFLALVLAELLVPVRAERRAPTSWHPGHIVERYGLFTIIVLGESMLAASIALQAATRAGDATDDLVPIIVGGLLIVFSMWWLYFDRPMVDLLGSIRRVFLWGYGHFAIFGSGAAVGAGLAVAVDHATGHGHVGTWGAGAAVTVPVAIYLLGVWILHARLRQAPTPGGVRWPVVAVLVLLTSWTGQAVLLTGLLLSGLLAVELVDRHRAGERGTAGG